MQLLNGYSSQVSSRVRDHAVTEDGYRSAVMAKSLRALSRRVGLTSSIVTYYLRREAAYLLAVNCTDEERCARMWHNLKDHIST